MTSYRTRRQDALALLAWTKEITAALERLVDLEAFVAQMAAANAKTPAEAVEVLNWAQQRARTLKLRRVAKMTGAKPPKALKRALPAEPLAS